MSYARKFEEMKDGLRSLNKAIPETAKGFGAFQKAAKESSPLSGREVELIALAIAIADRCEPCIMFHTEALKKQGGSRADCAAVGAVAMTMGGGPSYMYAAKALQAWDDINGAD